MITAIHLVVTATGRSMLQHFVSLNCILDDCDDPEEILQVTIELPGTVNDLKEALLAEDRYTFQNMSTKNLRLWRSSVPIDANFQKNIGKTSLLDDEFLPSFDPLSVHFMDTVTGCVHVIVRVKISSVDVPG